MTKKKNVAPAPSRPEAPCAPGSIEQQLDMCEGGELRGDELLHSHGKIRKNDPTSQVPDEVLTNYHIDMAEEGREGDEESGDDHSAGLQGGEEELKDQPHVDSGLPGDEDESTRNPEQLQIRRRAG